MARTTLAHTQTSQDHVLTINNGIHGEEAKCSYANATRLSLDLFDARYDMGGVYGQHPHICTCRSIPEGLRSVTQCRWYVSCVAHYIILPRPWDCSPVCTLLV